MTTSKDKVSFEVEAIDKFSSIFNELDKKLSQLARGQNRLSSSQIGNLIPDMKKLSQQLYKFIDEPISEMTKTKIKKEIDSSIKQAKDLLNKANRELQVANTTGRGGASSVDKRKLGYDIVNVRDASEFALQELKKNKNLIVKAYAEIDKPSIKKVQQEIQKELDKNSVKQKVDTSNKNKKSDAKKDDTKVSIKEVKKKKSEKQDVKVEVDKSSIDKAKKEIKKELESVKPKIEPVVDKKFKEIPQKSEKIKVEADKASVDKAKQEVVQELNKKPVKVKAEVETDKKSKEAKENVDLKGTIKSITVDKKFLSDNNGLQQIPLMGLIKKISVDKEVTAKYKADIEKLFKDALIVVDKVKSGTTLNEAITKLKERIERQLKVSAQVNNIKTDKLKPINIAGNINNIKIDQEKLQKIKDTNVNISAIINKINDEKIQKLFDKNVKINAIIDRVNVDKIKNIKDTNINISATINRIDTSKVKEIKDTKVPLQATVEKVDINQEKLQKVKDTNINLSATLNKITLDKEQVQYIKATKLDLEALVNKITIDKDKLQAIKDTVIKVAAKLDESTLGKSIDEISAKSPTIKIGKDESFFMKCIKDNLKKVKELSPVIELMAQINTNKLESALKGAGKEIKIDVDMNKAKDKITALYTMLQDLEKQNGKIKIQIDWTDITKAINAAKKLDQELSKLKENRKAMSQMPKETKQDTVKIKEGTANKLSQIVKDMEKLLSSNKPVEIDVKVDKALNKLSLIIKNLLEIQNHKVDINIEQAVLKIMELSTYINQLKSNAKNIKVKIDRTDITKAISAMVKLNQEIAKLKGNNKVNVSTPNIQNLTQVPSNAQPVVTPTVNAKQVRQQYQTMAAEARKYAQQAEMAWRNAGNQSSPEFERLRDRFQRQMDKMVEFRRNLGNLSAGAEANIFSNMARSVDRNLPLYDQLIERVRRLKQEQRELNAATREQRESRTSRVPRQQQSPWGTPDSLLSYITRYLGRSSKGFGSFLEAQAQLNLDVSQATGPVVSAMKPFIRGMTVAALGIATFSTGIQLAVSGVQTFGNMLITIGQTIYNVLKPGIELYKQQQAALFSFAAAIQSSGYIKEEQGIRSLQSMGQSGKDISRGMSEQLIQRATLDAEMSAFSLEELLRSMQGTLPILLNKGMSLGQAYEVNKGVAAVAKMTNLTPSQILQETRDLAQGSITSRGSQVANALGITNADLSKYQGDAEALFNFLMEKMKNFSEYLQEFEDTALGRYQQMMERLQNVSKSMVDAIAPQFKGLFEGIIEATGQWQDKNGNYLDSITNEWKDASGNVIATVDEVNKGLTDVVDKSSVKFELSDDLISARDVLVELVDYVAQAGDYLWDFIQKETGMSEPAEVAKNVIEGIVDIFIWCAEVVIELIGFIKDMETPIMLVVNAVRLVWLGLKTVKQMLNAIIYTISLVLAKFLKLVDVFPMLMPFLSAIAKILGIDLGDVGSSIESNMDSWAEEQQREYGEDLVDFVKQGLPTTFEGELGNYQKKGWLYQQLHRNDGKNADGSGKGDTQGKEMSDIKGNPDPAIKDNTKALKQAAKEAREAMRQHIKDLKDALNDHIEDIKEALKQNDIAYKEGFKSIEDYFNQKAALEREEAEARLQEAQEELAVIQSTTFENDYEKIRAEHEVMREIKKYSKALDKSILAQKEVTRALGLYQRQTEKFSRDYAQMMLQGGLNGIRTNGQRRVVQQQSYTNLDTIKDKDPYTYIALKASQMMKDKGYNVPAGWLLGQMKQEVGNFDTGSELSRTHNNFSGIKWYSGAVGSKGSISPEGDYYQKFDTIDDYIKEKIKVYFQSNFIDALSATSPEDFTSKIYEGGWFESGYSSYEWNIKHGEELLNERLSALGLSVENLNSSISLVANSLGVSASQINSTMTDTTGKEIVDNIGNLIAYNAFDYVKRGVPYVYGGLGKNGVDCSGLVYSIYRDLGIEIERQADYQADQMKNKGAWFTEAAKLMVGDLVFMRGSDPGLHGVGHVGIYAGNGQMVHAGGSGQQVKYTNLANRGDIVGYGSVRKLTGQFTDLSQQLGETTSQIKTLNEGLQQVSVGIDGAISGLQDASGNIIGYTPEEQYSRGGVDTRYIDFEAMTWEGVAGQEGIDKQIAATKKEVLALWNFIAKKYYEQTGEKIVATSYTGDLAPGYHNPHSASEEGHRYGWKWDIGVVSRQDILAEITKSLGVAVGNEGDHLDVSAYGGIGGYSINGLTRGDKAYRRLQGVISTTNNTLETSTVSVTQFSGEIERFSDQVYKLGEAGKLDSSAMRDALNIIVPSLTSANKTELGHEVTQAVISKIKDRLQQAAELGSDILGNITADQMGVVAKYLEQMLTNSSDPTALALIFKQFDRDMQKILVNRYEEMLQYNLDAILSNSETMGLNISLGRLDYGDSVAKYIGYIRDTNNKYGLGYFIKQLEELRSKFVAGGFLNDAARISKAISDAKKSLVDAVVGWIDQATSFWDRTSAVFDAYVSKGRFSPLQQKYGHEEIEAYKAQQEYDMLTGANGKPGAISEVGSLLKEAEERILNAQQKLESLRDISDEYAQNQKLINEYQEKISQSTDKTSDNYKELQENLDKATKRQEELKKSVDESKASQDEYNQAVKDRGVAEAQLQDLLYRQKLASINKHLLTDMERIEKAAKESLEDGLLTFLTDGITEAESLGDALRDLAKTILKGIQKQAAEILVKDIMTTINGQFNTPVEMDEKSWLQRLTTETLPQQVDRIVDAINGQSGENTNNIAQGNGGVLSNILGVVKNKVGSKNPLVNGLLSLAEAGVKKLENKIIDFANTLIPSKTIQEQGQDKAILDKMNIDTSKYAKGTVFETGGKTGIDGSMYDPWVKITEPGKETYTVTQPLPVEVVDNKLDIKEEPKIEPQVEEPKTKVAGVSEEVKTGLQEISTNTSGTKEEAGQTNQKLDQVNTTLSEINTNLQIKEQQSFGLQQNQQQGLGQTTPTFGLGQQQGLVQPGSLQYMFTNPFSQYMQGTPYGNAMGMLGSPMSYQLPALANSMFGMPQQPQLGTGLGTNTDALFSEFKTSLDIIGQDIGQIANTTGQITDIVGQVSADVVSGNMTQDTKLVEDAATQAQHEVELEQINQNTATSAQNSGIGGGMNWGSILAGIGLSLLSSAFKKKQRKELEYATPVRKASGGIIRGRGTGTSDSIPAMLSNGEFVVNAKNTNKYRHILESINNGTYDINSYASGGLVEGGFNSLATYGNDVVYVLGMDSILSYLQTIISLLGASASISSDSFGVHKYDNLLEFIRSGKYKQNEDVIGYNKNSNVDSENEVTNQDGTETSDFGLENTSEEESAPFSVQVIQLLTTIAECIVELKDKYLSQFQGEDNVDSLAAYKSYQADAKDDRTMDARRGSILTTLNPAWGGLYQGWKAFKSIWGDMDESEDRIIDHLGSDVSTADKIIIDLLQTISDYVLELVSYVQQAALSLAMRSIFPMFGFAKGGAVFTNQGMVNGPGSSTSDSIPAMLSNGEAVLNAKAVRKLGVNFVNAVNSGEFSKLAVDVPHFAGGGVVGNAQQETARGMTDFAKNVGTNVSMNNNMNIALVKNLDESTEFFMRSPQGQRILVDFARGNGRVFSRFNK